MSITLRKAAFLGMLALFVVVSVDPDIELQGESRVELQRVHSIRSAVGPSRLLPHCALHTSRKTLITLRSGPSVSAAQLHLNITVSNRLPVLRI